MRTRKKASERVRGTHGLESAGGTSEDTKRKRGGGGRSPSGKRRGRDNPDNEGTKRERTNEVHSLTGERRARGK